MQNPHEILPCIRFSWSHCSHTSLYLLCIPVVQQSHSPDVCENPTAQSSRVVTLFRDIIYRQLSFYFMYFLEKSQETYRNI